MFRKLAGVGRRIAPAAATVALACCSSGTEPSILVLDGVAEGAEIGATGESVEVPAGTFTNTLRFVETTPLESVTSVKVYAQGVGLIVDDAERLTSRSP